MATKKKKKVKTFKVNVTETYSKVYEIEAGDFEEALDKAEELASDDTELATPENMDDRNCEVI